MWLNFLKKNGPNALDWHFFFLYIVHSIRSHAFEKISGDD